MMGDDHDQELPRDKEAIRIAYLVAGFIRNNLTEGEGIELDKWVSASYDNQRLFEQLIDEENRERWKAQMADIDVEGQLQKLKSRMQFPVEKPRRSIKKIWMGIAAALVLVALAIPLLIPHKDHAVAIDKRNELVMKDINPGQKRATVQLSNGKTIVLDTISSGGFLDESGAVAKLADKNALSYEVNSEHSTIAAGVFNTLTIPAGGQSEQVILSDGTRVWLNAASSLRYPLKFTDSVRAVELIGEGYFEVAKDQNHRFQVKAGKASIEVLGTHFNVNAYPDEALAKVTLAEGSVRLNNSVYLKPGEEGSVYANGKIDKQAGDVHVALAWKDGQFVFRQMKLDGLMRQVARVYDARIVFTAAIDEHFNAEIGRDVPVSKLLHILEATGAVHFTIEDNTITVMK